MTPFPRRHGAGVSPKPQTQALRGCLTFRHLLVGIARLDPGGPCSDQKLANVPPITQPEVSHQPVVAVPCRPHVDVATDNQLCHQRPRLGPEGLIKLGRVHAAQLDLEPLPVACHGRAGIAVVAGGDDGIKGPSPRPAERQAEDEGAAEGRLAEIDWFVGHDQNQWREQLS